jgi:hypothetical protein
MLLATAATMMKNPTARTVSSLATCFISTSFPISSMCPNTHVELSRDSGGSDSCTEDDTTSLGPQRGGWDGVDDGSSLLVGRLL